MNNNENNSSNDTKAIKSAKGYLLVFLVAVLCGYALLSISKNDGQTLPMIGGKGCAVVMTGSMEPNLPTDALVFVSKSESYEKGDIVVIQDGYSLVVHRIVSIDENEVVTKGDANNTEDAPAPVSHIKGKVTSYIPKVGMVVRMIKTPYGSVTIVAVMIILLAFSEKKKNKQADKPGEASASDEISNEEIKKEIEKLKAQLEQKNKNNND